MEFGKIFEKTAKVDELRYDIKSSAVIKANPVDEGYRGTFAYEIKAEDVGKSFVKTPSGKGINLRDVMGPVQKRDVGKRVYLTGPGVYQVESDDQLAKRKGTQESVSPEAAVRQYKSTIADYEKQLKDLGKDDTEKKEKIKQKIKDLRKLIRRNESLIEKTKATVRRRKDKWQVVSPDGIVLWDTDSKDKAQDYADKRNKRSAKKVNEADQRKYSEKLGNNWYLDLYVRPNGTTYSVLRDEYTGHGDNPIYYDFKDSVAYDYPERIPSYIKAKVLKYERLWHKEENAGGATSEAVEPDYVNQGGPGHGRGLQGKTLGRQLSSDDISSLKVGDLLAHVTDKFGGTARNLVRVSKVFPDRPDIVYLRFVNAPDTQRDIALWDYMLDYDEYYLAEARVPGKVVFENEGGIINQPGKFEGEMYYVPYFWEESMNGADWEADGVWGIKITDEDRQKFPELAPEDAWIFLEESEQGFVRGEVKSEEEAQELMSRLSSEDAEMEEKKLTYKDRKRLSPKSFVFPKDRKYPIEDLPHARNALARVSQHGTPEEKDKVRAAVYRKYPSLKKNESITEEKQWMILNPKDGLFWNKKSGWGPRESASFYSEAEKKENASTVANTRMKWVVVSEGKVNELEGAQAGTEVIYGWVRDGYLIAASDEMGASDWYYWELMDPVENGDEIVEVVVPAEEAEKFLNHGTSDQFYGDGYEAYEALKKIGKDFEVVNTAEGIEADVEEARKELSVPDKHQLRVLKQILRMPDQMAAVAGGPDKKEAREILKSKFGYTDEMIAKLEEKKIQESNADVALWDYMLDDGEYYLAESRVGESVLKEGYSTVAIDPKKALQMAKGGEVAAASYDAAFQNDTWKRLVASAEYSADHTPPMIIFKTKNDEWIEVELPGKSS